MLFTTFIRVINLELQNSLFDLSSKNYLDITSASIIALINAQYPSITASYTNLSTANFIAKTSGFLILQFPDTNAIIYTAVFTYSPSWHKSLDLQLVLCSFLSASSSTSDNPYTISQVLSWQTGIFMARISSYYKIYSISSNG